MGSEGRVMPRDKRDIQGMQGEGKDVGNDVLEVSLGKYSCNLMIIT
jgi:hypothetical protein